MNLLIARELKSLRIKADMRMEDVANNLNVSKETLRKYEKDSKNISIEFLERILNYYKVDKLIFFKNICEYTNINKEEE